MAPREPGWLRFGHAWRDRTGHTYGMPRVLSRPHATQKGTGRTNAGHCPAMSPQEIAATTRGKCGTLSRHVPRNDRVTVRDKCGTLSLRVPQRRRAPAVSGFHLIVGRVMSGSIGRQACGERAVPAAMPETPPISSNRTALETVFCRVDTARECEEPFRARGLRFLAPRRRLLRGPTDA
jgi:hypothetical protein